MDERHTGTRSAGTPALDLESLRLETIDRIGPDAAYRLIHEATERYLSADRVETWRRRREQTLHRLNVIDRNLDYDLQRIAR